MSAHKTRRILFPVDQSEHTKRAIQWYLDKFMHPDDTIYLVHVAEPQYSKTVLDTNPNEVANELSAKMKALVHIGESLGDELQNMLKEKGLQSKFLLRAGHKPGEQIILIAEEHLIDVIIIGNRGVGAIRRTVLGSVSDYILHHVSIPVVIVPPTIAS